MHGYAAARVAVRPFEIDRDADGTTPK